MHGYLLLKLRKALALYANFRPVVLYPELIGASTLKAEVVEGVDMMILRELNEICILASPAASPGMNPASVSESIPCATARLKLHASLMPASARRRRGKLCSVDKANVLETMALWREVVIEVSAEYPDVELSHLFVDAASMALIRNPREFDVIVTGNVFGDILSDAAAMLAGSIGMLPSASLGDNKKGLYEPIHGTAPDIAGQNIAKPACCWRRCCATHSIWKPIPLVSSRRCAPSWRMATALEIFSSPAARRSHPRDG